MPALKKALGGVVPSVFACYRFTAKLRRYEALITRCIDRVLGALKKHNPEMGKDVAIDGTDLPAYANGQRYVSKGGRERRPEEYSDPDASWGHRSAISTRKGGGYYGHKLHLAVDTATELPIGWHLDTAKSSEIKAAPRILDDVRRRGFVPETAAMDKGYDAKHIYDEFEARDVRPIIPLRQTGAVKEGKHLPHCCRHGEWVPCGMDAKRKATKWRCPTAQCPVSHRWVPASRLHTLIPRTTERWKKLRSARGAIERGIGRLKNESALLPLRVRGLERVQLHADLTILAKLSCALARARAAPLAA
jgi:hypothetical protein